MLRCTCCEQTISARNLSRRHIWDMGTFEDITLPNGQRATVRTGTEQKALCRDCAARIEAGYEKRIQARRHSTIQRPPMTFELSRGRIYVGGAA